MNLMLIDESEIVPINSTTLPSKFVAAAVELDPNTRKAKHSGIVMKHDSTYKLFHFDGRLWFDDAPVNNWYFHKRLDFIKEEEIENFIAHCEIIKKESNPRYGFYYPGSHYDSTGQYFSKIPNTEFMTCVGLCLNTIKGFIEDDEYFRYTDWTIADNHMTMSFITDTIIGIRAANPTLSNVQIMEDIRRILPDEYFASTYLKTMPIRKHEIDVIIDAVRIALINKT
ncbi:hypothetical protein SAMN05660461_1839 [Chitinophaga ginsengisegetis]|uniref:Uncharacterized protein n=1 Tax=Chitinophaga ginsengisegetis TaxID=393003 RepID=A0A1T5NJ59_9BACT|nr:hypothetical protein [Chitinophaga ginsengisegetis]SKD00491.1 hypothetical protein SAMN05660461_1839 [Chitinophaga ginsengisegetis]